MPHEEGEHKWTIMARQMESGTLSAIKANSPPFSTQVDFFSIIARLHGSSDTLVLALPISKQARWCRGDEGMGALWFPCFSVKWRDKKHQYYKPRKPCRFWRQGVVDWGESQRESGRLTWGMLAVVVLSSAAIGSQCAPPVAGFLYPTKCRHHPSGSYR